MNRKLQVEQTIRRSPSLMRQLGGYALSRHGWGDSDGGFGVNYPTDLDEYDRQVDGVEIPSGYVLVYGFWGPPDGYEFLITEAEYISDLLLVLPSHFLGSNETALRSLLESLNSLE